MGRNARDPWFAWYVTTEAPVTAPPVAATRARWALLALAVGGFAIGTTEFMTMGLLAEIADSIGRTKADTGHIITAYAFGVVVGAPVIVSLGARLPRRELAMGLILALGLGNGLTAIVSSYDQMMVARFISGLPHGAYFGVASLLAASLVPAHQRGRAISSVMLGLSVATVAGVPASTFLGQRLGWESAYWLVLAISVAAVALIAVFVPHTPGDRTASVKRELTALKRSQVWFAMSAGIVGFGGLFAMYTYISPIVTDVIDLGRGAIPVFLLIFGFGSVFGAWLAGVLADWDVERSVISGFVAMALSLLLFFFLVEQAVAAAVLIFVVGALGSVLAITLQVRLMAAAGEAEMLGAALNHSSLNVANGLGAALGSVVITAGYGYSASSIVGAGLAVAGLAVFLVGLAVGRRPSGIAQTGPAPRV